jgi:hypothetical protein
MLRTVSARHFPDLRTCGAINRDVVDVSLGVAQGGIVEKSEIPRSLVTSGVDFTG